MQLHDPHVLKLKKIDAHLGGLNTERIGIIPFIPVQFKEKVKLHTYRFCILDMSNIPISQHIISIDIYFLYTYSP